MFTFDIQYKLVLISIFGAKQHDLKLLNSRRIQNIFFPQRQILCIVNTKRGRQIIGHQHFKQAQKL